MLLVVLAACSVPGEPIRDWTLSADGDHTPVTLPGNFYSKLPMRDQDYTLRASVAIPADLRGRELSVIAPCFHGDIALSIDGARAVDRGDAAAGEHRWPVSVEQSVRGTLALELVALFAREPGALVGHRIQQELSPAILHRQVDLACLRVGAAGEAHGPIR